LLITALTFFLFGSFISAVAGNFKTLHIGRSLQGIGAGGIYGLSKLIVSDISSTVIRSKWNAMISATYVLLALL
jgi:MFS family permease